MALLKIIDTNCGKLGIWKLNEPEKKLHENYHLSETEKKEFNQIKNEKRKREYLAVRLLLKEMLRKKTEIIYSYDGKPTFVNSSLHISISHSQELAVILLSNGNAGVDTENIYRKTETIASRFLSKKELEDILESANPELLRIIYWSAKEAVFKYSSLPDIDFRSNIYISPFHPEPEGGKFSGELHKGDQIFIFTFTYFFHENNVVIYCVEEIST